VPAGMRTPSRLRKNARNDFCAAGNAGEALSAAAEFKDKFFVLEREGVKNSRVQVAERMRVAHRHDSHIIGGPDALSRFGSASRKPDSESRSVMVADFIT